MQFGLAENQIKLLIDIFKKYSAINEIVLYGSRAKGNYSDRSDIDLVVRNSDVDRHLIADILLEIDNSDFPFLVDLQNFSQITNQQLIDHINRVGKIFYKK